jgi:hypothetical protein
VASDGESEADESDDSFNFFSCNSHPDPDVIHAMALKASRHRTTTKGPPKITSFSPDTKLPPSSQIAARIGKTETRYVELTASPQRWNTHVTRDLAKLANTLPTYSSGPSTLCPDSGATSIMAPHRDMFINYVDISSKGLVVCLGDENQTILIMGEGTLCMQIDGRKVAYGLSYHVPDLTAILLSSRVHRHIAPGCSLVADHSGCFLTYPTFSVEIDNTSDCTLECHPVANPETTSYDFDSRLHINVNSSRKATIKCHALTLRQMHHARHVAVRQASNRGPKSPDVVGMPKLPQVPITNTPFPFAPVYSVPETNLKTMERLPASELKHYFGSRHLKDWTVLEQSGTDIKVVNDGEAPLPLGDVANI